jgi:hypothetical protein
MAFLAAPGPLDLYRDNPFRVLSIAVTADPAVVREHARALRATLGDEVERAAARLAHPLLRLEDELYWFWLDGGPAALRAMVSSPETADPIARTLDRAAAEGSDVALHDLAVLRHVAALEGPGPGPWTPALQAWARTWRADPFWARVRQRAAALTGPESADTAAGRLREELPGRILSATAAAVAGLLAAGRDADAAAAVIAIGASGFPPAAVRSARSEPVMRIVLQVGDLLAASRADLAADPRQLVGTAGHLRALDPTSTSAERVLDEVADHLCRLAIQRARANGDLATALALVEAAAVVAMSVPVRRRAQAARDECEAAWTRAYELVSGHARELATAGHWPDAITAAQQARRLARNPEMAREWDQAIAYWSAPPAVPAVPAPPAPRSSGGRAVIIMVAIVAAILVGLCGVNLRSNPPVPERTQPGLVLASEPPAPTPSDEPSPSDVPSPSPSPSP